MPCALFSRSKPVKGFGKETQNRIICNNIWLSWGFDLVYYGENIQININA